MEYEIMNLQQMVLRDIFADSGNFAVGLALDQSFIPLPSVNTFNQNLEQPSIVLYKEIVDEGENGISIFKGNFSDGHKIMDFCNTESLPLVTEYTEENAYRLYGGPVPSQIVLFLDPSKDNKKILKEFSKAASQNRKNKTKLINFVKSELGEKEYESFVDQYGVSLKDTPCIFLSEIDHTLATMTKYEYIKDEIKAELILDFIDEYLDQKLPVYYKSEPLPDNSDNKMRILVGKNFDQEVIKSEDNICVLFCSEQVPTHCQNAIKIFKFIAESLPVEKSHKIKFGYFDLAKNEVGNLVVNDVPHLRMYRKGEKKKFKQFQMEFTVKNVLIFLNYYVAGLKYYVSEEDLTDFIHANMPEADKKAFEEAKEKQEKEKSKGKVYEEVDFDQMQSRLKGHNKDGAMVMPNFDHVESSHPELFKGPEIKTEM